MADGDGVGESAGSVGRRGQSAEAEVNKTTNDGADRQASPEGATRIQPPGLRVEDINTAQRTGKHNCTCILSQSETTSILSKRTEFARMHRIIGATGGG